MSLTLGFAGVASATVPPFTKGSEPPTITSPLVVFTPDNATVGIFDIQVGAGVTCPDTPTPYALTLSDPYGTVSIGITDPCVAVWGPITPPITPSEDVTLNPINGVNIASILDVPGISITEQQLGPADAIFDITSGTSTPFLYQVSTPTGVIAQAALTLRNETTPPDIVDEKNNIDQFINICIDGDYTIYSHDNGDLYCDTGSTDADAFVSGWPVPPPTKPASTSKPAKPIPKSPILAGPWSSGQVGYGHAKPVTIFNGGDPTGLVTHIDWTDWGHAEAIGTGTAEYVGPTHSVASGTEESARIVVFHLAVCHGHAAYNAIEWYFPQHGQHFKPNTYIDPCTGAYYPKNT
jgi:hypothetical protein